MPADTVTHIPNHTATEEFPWDLEATSAYDVVILSDISADTLQIHPDCFDRGQRTPDRLRVLADYVRAGGGLLMVGGYMSFSGLEGKAHYEMTPLADVLPVGMLGRDDRVETPEGEVPQVEHAHEVLAGIDGEWPWFLGYNRLLPKDGGDVLMTIAGDRSSLSAITATAGSARSPRTVRPTGARRSSWPGSTMGASGASC